VALSRQTMQGHPKKRNAEIQKRYSRVNCRALSFANLCIDAWNSLDNDVICASSVQAFKRPESAQFYYVLVCFIGLGWGGVSVSLSDHPFLQ